MFDEIQFGVCLQREVLRWNQGLCPPEAESRKSRWEEGRLKVILFREAKKLRL